VPRQVTIALQVIVTRTLIADERWILFAGHLFRLGFTEALHHFPSRFSRIEAVLPHLQHHILHHPGHHPGDGFCDNRHEDAASDHAKNESQCISFNGDCVLFILITPF
jgi:hypothetical protein